MWYVVTVALAKQCSLAKVLVIYSKGGETPREFQLGSDVRSQRSQELLGEDWIGRG